MENIKNMNTEQLKDLFRQAQAELTRRENIEREIRWKHLESALRKYLEVGNITYIDVSGDSYTITLEDLDLKTVGIISNADW
jgi:hypothetical protein